MRWPVTDERAAFYWLLLTAAVVIAAGIGLRDPWPADEPRFALVARDMVDSGRWFFPRVAGVLYPDKPPLYFWLLAAGYALTGSVRASFLLPSLAAGLGTLVLVYDLGRRLWHRRAAWWAAAALLTCVQFLLFTRSARIDATLMLLVTLGMYGFARHLLLGPAWKWYLAGFAACGLGVITKGVGFLPVLVLLVWPLARRGPCRYLAHFPSRWWHWAAGPAAMLAAIALWLLPMLWLVAAGDDPALATYRDNILFRQTGERYVDPWHHFEPPWYYLVSVMPLFWFPLSASLVWLLPAWRPALKARDARVLLPLAWVVLVVGFFSLSPGKRGAYILPALPMLALAAGPFLPSLADRRSLRASVLAVLAAATLALAGLTAWLAMSDNTELTAQLIRYQARDIALSLLAAFTVTTVCCLLLAWRRDALAGLATWLTGIWVVLGLVGYPLLNDLRTPADIMARAARATGDGELGLVDWKAQNVLFADRPLVHFGYRRDDETAELGDGLAWLLAGADRYLLVTSEHAAPCLVLSSAQHLGYRHRQDWYLVTADAVRRGCRDQIRRSEHPAVTYHPQPRRPGVAP